MYTTLYIKNEFIEKYNSSHQDKIIDSTCRLLRKLDEGSIVLCKTSNLNSSIRTIIIPYNFLMIDFIKENNIC